MCGVRRNETYEYNESVCVCVVGGGRGRERGRRGGRRGGGNTNPQTILYEP